MSSSIFLLSLGPSGRRYRLLLAVDSIMVVRQPWSSRVSWWTRRPDGPWFSPRSRVPNEARYSCLTLDSWRPDWSVVAI